MAFVLRRFGDGVKRHSLSPAVWSAFPSAGKRDRSLIIVV